MKRVLIATIVAAVAAAVPAWAGAATIKGIVVEKSPARGTIAVASTRGAVSTLHVRKLVRVGSLVTVTAARRADGTYSASRVDVRGRAHRARIHGVVVARSKGRVLLAAGKSMIAVRTTAQRTLASAKDGPPGTTVDTEVDISDNGELDEQSETEDGDQGVVEIEGTVAAIGTGTIDIRTEGGMIVTVTVPSTIQLNAAVGDEIELKASVQGTTLTLLSSDSEDEGGDDDGGD